MSSYGTLHLILSVKTIIKLNLKRKLKRKNVTTVIVACTVIRPGGFF